ncbi:MAG: GNAT family N-acetyltransferase [Flavobacteriaceae bacterium]|nr:MAG: GNAT family N-acetyltransferase [Flavobacteriaceae bacterium]
MIAEFETFDIALIHDKDAWAVCDLVIANEDRFKRYFPITLAENLTPTLSKNFCVKKVKQFLNKEEYLFTIKEKETHALVGLVYIKNLDWNIRQGEFGYCIGYPFKGKGVITKAIKVLSEYAFKKLGLESLQIIVHKTNIASIKVAEDNSFLWMKTLEKGFTPPNEEALDMELYVLSK